MSKTNHIQLEVQGMTCSNCAAGIERHFKKQGYDDVNVNFSLNELTLDAPSNISLSDIISQVDQLGYHAKYAETFISNQKGISTLEWLFIISALCSLPLLLSMIFDSSVIADKWVQFSLATPVIIIAFYHFGKSALHSLKNGSPNMNVLILIGATSAYAYSIYSMVSSQDGYLYFETSAVIISMVLLGNIIEKRALGQTTSAIGALLKMQPKNANRISPDDSNHIESVKVSDLMAGDMVQVNSGDSFPADGKVISGEGSVDESYLTGESQPKFIKTNDEVVGGTMMLDGNVRVSLTSVGKDTVLSDVINLVKRTQNEKPSIQKMADKVSGVFVVIIVLIALVTLVTSIFLFDISVHQAILNSIAVLVISCPCAMGLATPTAMMVGVGKMYQSGILVKNGNAIENLAKAKNLLFDKTGTLTTGKMDLTSIHYHGMDASEANAIILELERRSSHPIASGLKESLKTTHDVKLQDIKEVSGAGISGVDEFGNKYQFGSARFVGIKNDNAKHDLYLIKNKNVLAEVNLSDNIKIGAAEAVQFLQERKINTVIVSGDSSRKCEQTAKILNIKDVYSELQPHEKLEIVNAYAEKGSTVMVGDGINDAAALSKASVSISMSNASQIAINSSDIVLLKGDMKLIEKAFLFSSQTLKTIKENLFWALSYNLIAIPLAVSGVINPMFAAVFMSFSSLAVVGNSIRMKYKKFD